MYNKLSTRAHYAPVIALPSERETVRRTNRPVSLDLFPARAALVRPFVKTSLVDRIARLFE